METKKKKKFRLVDAILATVCITLVAESVAPTCSYRKFSIFLVDFINFSILLTLWFNYSRIR